MIDASPQHNLATALGGTVVGPSTIQVGAFVITAYFGGVVRVSGPGVRGVVIGNWSDPTDELAAAFRRLAAAEAS